MNDIKNELKKYLENYLNKEYNLKSSIIIEEPKDLKLGDLSIPLFSYIKLLNKKLPEIFNIFREQLLKIDYIKEINFLNGFLNIILNKEKISFDILKSIDLNYGSSDVGNNQTICIDYSSPNIAKRFSIGHLRSTVIGHSLKKIHEKLGFKVIGINHLGDWGTQFGKLIVAYQKWGNKEDIIKNPIDELQKLYVKYHENETEELDNKARHILKELEDGNKEYLEIWQWFRDESLKEFLKIYDKLDVKFDSYNGEAFYNDKMQAIIDELNEKKLLKLDNNAHIVELDNLTPALITRSDGGSLYITRDLAALFYRYNTYHFDKMLYVVGNEQKLHFEQIKQIVKKMGYNFYDDIYHINFGLVLINGKKMSTRKGSGYSLDEIINQVCDMAYKQIEEKNPNLKNKKEIADKIGISAIIFNDLKNFRTLDIDFNLKNMLKFEGQTGPYLQYSNVRIKSILKDNNYDINNMDLSYLNLDHYFEIVRTLSKFPDVLNDSINDFAPSYLARYLLNLASLFNKFYNIEKILCDDERKKNLNLFLISKISIVLESGMNLLCMKVLDEM